MELPEVEIIESDIELSKFARVLALPVRISLVRIISQDDFGMNQDMFAGFSMSPVIIGRHLYELKSIGILDSKYVNRKTYYTINKDVLKKMAADFSTLFNNENGVLDI